MALGSVVSRLSSAVISARSGDKSQKLKSINSRSPVFGSYDYVRF